MAHVLNRDRDLPAYSFGVRAAHGVDERRLAFQRDHDIARERVPFPMAGEPQHAAAEAPVTRAAGHDERVELVLVHFRPQRTVTAVIFGF